jgi:hypothetical protein
VQLVLPLLLVLPSFRALQRCSNHSSATPGNSGAPRDHDAKVNRKTTLASLPPLPHLTSGR